MNYEKKYKEALERAKTLYENANGMILKKWVEQVFPELAESEDESIRKDLIEWIEEFPDTIWRGHYTKDVIAWLEKQDKHKPIDMSIKEKAHQIAWETSKHYDPFLSKESWCEMAALDMASWLEKQGKQKWTDEDEKRLQSCISSLQGKGLMGSVDTINTKWLKSIKQRMEQ